MTREFANNMESFHHWMNTEIKFNAAPKSRLWFSAWAATFGVQRLPWQIHLESVHQCFQGARPF